MDAPEPVPVGPVQHGLYFLGLGNVREDVHEALEPQPDASAREEPAFPDFVPAELDPVPDWVDFGFFRAEDEVFAEAEFPDAVHGGEDFGPAPHDEDVVHVPDGPDFQDVLEELVEVVEVEIREQLGEYPADGDSLPGFVHVGRVRREQSVVPAVRPVAVDYAVHDTE